MAISSRTVRRSSSQNFTISSNYIIRKYNPVSFFYRRSKTGVMFVGLPSSLSSGFKFITVSTFMLYGRRCGVS